MLHKRFLAYYADPFSLADPIFAVKGVGKEPPQIIGASELALLDANFVTFQGEHLVDALRVRDLPLPRLIDIRHAFQLASGCSRKDDGRSEWRFSEWLRLTDLGASERKMYLALLDGETARPDEATISTLLLRTSIAISDVWEGISRELERLGELDRFIRFEIPSQQLMYKRQMRGIRVDLAKSQEYLADAKSVKYTAMLKLGERLQANPTGLTYKSVLPLLRDTDAANLSSFAESRSLASYFKMASVHSQSAREFREMLQANRNIKALLALTASGGRIFPTFDCLGTVTARIQSSTPNVQQLKRAYRSALLADPAMHSCYLDYAQYEPGIIAQLVGPGRFRDLYNSGDVYAALCEVLFGQPSRREIAKQVFIAFCYGMEVSSIGKLLGASGDASDGTAQAKVIAAFFRQFPELTKYKDDCEVKLLENGFIASKSGNRRVRRKGGPLTRREKGWAMNQVIQGTGSLIFKDALLSLAHRFGDDSILIPIHDAVWLQVPCESMSLSEFQAEATDVMQRAFRRWCPDVNIRVKTAQFGES